LYDGTDVYIDMQELRLLCDPSFVHRSFVSSVCYINELLQRNDAVNVLRLLYQTKKITVIIAKEGQMRFAGQASSQLCLQYSGHSKTEIDYFGRRGVPNKLALRVTWPSYGNTTVNRMMYFFNENEGKLISNSSSRVVIF
jgi:hypothetical protein